MLLEIERVRPKRKEAEVDNWANWGQDYRILLPCIIYNLFFKHNHNLISFAKTSINSKCQTHSSCVKN